MHRVRGLLVLALLLVPSVSYAIQLHWSSGTDTLTFTEPTRAILVLRADSAEVALRIGLPSATRAGLRIYDAAGRLQRTLVDGVLPAGTTVVSWDGRDRSGQRVQSGMYFGRLVGGGTQRVVKLPLLR